MYFDTNSPHKAGILLEGHSREVLRFDYVHPADMGLLNKIRSKLPSWA